MKLIESISQTHNWVSWVVTGETTEGFRIRVYEDIQRAGDGFVKAYIKGWQNIEEAQAESARIR